jgi:hypothetical protein
MSETATEHTDPDASIDAEEVEEQAEDAKPGTQLMVHNTAANVPALLRTRLAYARELADAKMLPEAYRKQPANVLYATEYADMLGISPMAAIQGLHIIDGKVTGSAAFVQSLVRKAGHKLRVTVEDDPAENGRYPRATVTIVRHDDPDFPFIATWTVEKAVQAGLMTRNPQDGSVKGIGRGGKPSNWDKYLEDMLVSRATTSAARRAAQEALNGVMYTPEEIGVTVDEDGAPVLGRDDEVVEAEIEPPTTEEFTRDLAVAFKQGVEGLKAFGNHHGRDVLIRVRYTSKDGRLMTGAQAIDEAIKVVSAQAAAQPAAQDARAQEPVRAQDEAPAGHVEEPVRAQEPAQQDAPAQEEAAQPTAQERATRARALLMYELAEQAKLLGETREVVAGLFSAEHGVGIGQGQTGQLASFVMGRRPLAVAALEREGRASEAASYKRAAEVQMIGTWTVLTGTLEPQPSDVGIEQAVSA